MDSDTERVVLEALEFLMAREGVFLEAEMARGRQLLTSSLSETNAPQIDVLRGLMEDRDRARELLNSIMTLRQGSTDQPGG